MMDYQFKLIQSKLSEAIGIIDEQKEYLNCLAEVNQKLQEENSILHSEHFKDEALKKANETIELLRNQFDKSFTISDEEYDSIEIWKSQHETDFHNGNGAGGVCGGRYTYCFTPTSLGTVGTIKCSCGAEFTFSEI